MHRHKVVLAVFAGWSVVGADRAARAQDTAAGGTAPATNAPASGAGSPSGGTGSPGGATPSVPLPPPSMPGAAIYGPPAAAVPGAPVVNQNAHLPSSSQPSNDTSRASDYFDLAPSSSGGSTMHGDANSPFNIGRTESSQPPPPVHVVQRGDTLWDVCERYFHSPWDWPRIWSYNPELQNPHWIYPGDQLRLQSKEAPVATGAAPSPDYPVSGMVRKTRVQPGTVFLRDQGYMDDKIEGIWGELGGSPQDQLLLSEGDAVYLDIAAGHDLRLGQELTVFRPITKGRLSGGAKGTLVAILGTVRIDKWDPETRMARAMLTESLDVIERGVKVGPLQRRFDVIPPVRNEVDLWAHVSASLYPYVIYGQNQVVFIDRGQADGLVPGNRLFAIVRGDEYRKTLFGASDYAAASVQYESEKPATVEKDGALGHGDERNYPDEVVGEIRVLSVREHTATCLVMSATREIEPGQRVVIRRGY